MALDQRRQAEPAAQPEGARVPPGRARPGRPGRRGGLRLLPRGARALRPGSRRPACARQPAAHRDVDDACSATGPAVARPRLRQHGRGHGRVLRAHRLARPAPGRAVPRLHRRHLTPPDRRVAPGRARLAATAPARASASTSPRPRAASTSSSQAVLDQAVNGHPQTRLGNADRWHGAPRRLPVRRAGRRPTGWRSPARRRANGGRWPA